MQQGGQCSSGFRLHYTVTILNPLLIPHMIVVDYTVCCWHFLESCSVSQGSVLLFSCCFSLDKAYKCSTEKCINFWSGCIFLSQHCSMISQFLCGYIITLYLHEQLLRIWLIVPVNLMNYFGEDSKCVISFDFFSVDLPLQICQTFGNTH